MNLSLSLAVDNGDWGVLAQIASKKGSHSGQPVNKIELELKAYIKTLNGLALSSEEIKQKILEWVL